MQKTLKLKPDDLRSIGICDASRCTSPSTVIDGTHKLDPRDLDLCDDHLVARNIRIYGNN